MIIGIDMGHTLNPGNYGAIGLKNESEETRNVGNRVIKYLECMGNTVVDVTVDYADTRQESLTERVRRANAQKLDLLVSLHFNAFDGERHGSEIYTYGGRQLPSAVRILNNLSGLGFQNSGIFDGSSLYMIRRTYAPTLLVEIAYIDSPIDMEIYDPELVAQAIVRGITNREIPEYCFNRCYDDLYRVYDGQECTDSSDLYMAYNGDLCTSSRNLYRVVVSEALEYEDADNIANEIEDIGYKTFIESID